MLLLLQALCDAATAAAPYSWFNLALLNMQRFVIMLPLLYPHRDCLLSLYSLNIASRAGNAIVEVTDQDLDMVE
jgi:hypothetical protein